MNGSAAHDSFNPGNERFLFDKGRDNADEKLLLPERQVSGENPDFILKTGTMSITLFTDTLKEALLRKIPEAEISFMRIKKNNNTKLRAFRIGFGPRGRRVEPLVYIDELFRDYKAGESLQSIASRIKTAVWEAYEQGKYTIEDITNFEAMKSRICLRVINTGLNEEFLKTVPNFPFLDLSVVCYILLDTKKHACVTVNNEILKKWGKEPSDLFEIGLNNTKRLLGSRLSPINRVIEGFFGEEKVLGDKEKPATDGGELISTEAKPAPEWEELLPGEEGSICEEDYMPVYVATVNEGCEGAVVFLYEDLLSFFAKRIGGDFFILPSSVHELIFLPATKDTDHQYLKDMVKEVNRTALKPSEILSDNIYLYSKKDRNINLL